MTSSINKLSFNQTPFILLLSYENLNPICNDKFDFQ